VAEIETLTQLVDDHLSAEEELMVPLINENITDAEWRAVTEQGATFIGHNLRFALAFVGMTLQECTADERRRFLVGMPAPQRLLVRLLPGERRPAITPGSGCRRHRLTSEQENFGE
jgi:hypothetical protein